MRKRWIYVDGVAIPADEYTREPQHGVTVVPDIQPFRSPVDGTLITGRAALREHNVRNNVVQTLDLKGLPPKLSVQPPQSNRAAIRQTLINEFHRRDEHGNRKQ